MIQSASSVDEAVELFDPESTEAIFLDIEMPGSNGFDLLSKIGEAPPPVIFTTAYEQFAAKAFEVNAIDYLLKPFGEDRLAKALARLKTPPAHVKRLAEGDLLLLKFDEECQLVPVEKIEFFETTGNVTHAFWGGKSGYISKSMTRTADSLDENMFFQASRDQLVNLRCVRSYSTDASGIVTALLQSNRTIHFSRRQSVLFRKRASI
jgi:two-component system LytT family response regulator